MYMYTWMNLAFQLDANSLKREPRVRNSDLDYIASNGKTIDGEWFGRDLEGSVSILIEVRGDAEYYYKISVRIAGILGEIRTEYPLELLGFWTFSILLQNKFRTMSLH
jgi:hypothetical protein